MGVDHIKVALVDRHVDRFADRAAGVMQPGRGLRQLHEIAEILDGAVAATTVEIHHEGRTVSRRENNAFAADQNRLRRVARMLHELRRRGLQDFAQHARFEFHQRSSATGSSRNSMPISARIRSAVVSMRIRFSSERMS